MGPLQETFGRGVDWCRQICSSWWGCSPCHRWTLQQNARFLLHAKVASIITAKCIAHWCSARRGSEGYLQMWWQTTASCSRKRLQSCLHHCCRWQDFNYAGFLITYVSEIVLGQPLCFARTTWTEYQLPARCFLCWWIPVISGTSPGL